MNEHLLFFLYLMTAAGVTYLIRMLPLVFVRRKIENRYLKSFLYYIPYAVLTAMTLPAIFYSTGYIISAVIGFLVAVALAYFNRGLLTVAIGATATVFIVETVIKIF
jgi:branched-subunit amino acid transport protein